VSERLIERLADLVVGFGANVQPGQIVAVSTGPGKEALTRAIAEAAYERGAKFVDVAYFDGHVKRARIAHADESTLDFVPPWYGERILELGRHRAARVSLVPSVDPGVLAGVDPARAGRDQLPAVKELSKVIAERSTNWTAAACPVPSWARVVHPGLDESEALARLWEDVAHVSRLDEDDPVAAWRERMRELDDVAARLTDRRFDTLRFEGPGTDLRVGVLPTSRWLCALFSTSDGIPHLVNLPSEEVFATPDPDRVDGVVTSTRPLDLYGVTVRGLRVRFEGGRAVEIDADEGADALRTMAGKDEGASRLGEVALVDRESRIGRLGRTFAETLLDENAASHVALGSAYEFSVKPEDLERVNRSQIHVDFMIGSDEVDVTGVTAGGAEVPVLREGAWRL